MVSVSCTPTDEGWSCAVTVGDDAGATRHVVVVASDDLERLGLAAEDPEAVVRAAFEYLLEREPRESILREFTLPVIGRYFPGWEADVGQRLRGPDPGSST